jgi:hypothetical protein
VGGPEGKWLGLSGLERTEQLASAKLRDDDSVMVPARCLDALVTRPRNDVDPGDGTEPAPEKDEKEQDRAHLRFLQRGALPNPAETLRNFRSASHSLRRVVRPQSHPCSAEPLPFGISQVFAGDSFHQHFAVIAEQENLVPGLGREETLWVEAGERYGFHHVRGGLAIPGIQPRFDATIDGSSRDEVAPSPPRKRADAKTTKIEESRLTESRAPPAEHVLGILERNNQRATIWYGVAEANEEPTIGRRR